MVAVSLPSADLQTESTTLASRPSVNAALLRLFKEIEEEWEGPLSVATQCDDTAFPARENLRYDHERCKNDLRKNLQASLRADVSVEQFCEHVWGLDAERITAILSRDWKVNQPMLSRYNRQPHGSSTRRRPFRAIWSNLQADVLSHFGISYRDTKDEFWDMDEALENFLPEGAFDLLRIWKSDIPTADEVDIAPNWEDIKAFVVFSQVQSTRTCQQDLETLVPPTLHFPVNDLYPHGNSLTGQKLFASLKRRHAHNYPQSSSTPKNARSSRALTEDEVRLARYAVESLGGYSRRYVTGILVDGTCISLYYMDHNLAIRTTTFDFSAQEGTRYLALTIFALTQCDSAHAGFNPCIRLLRLSEDLCIHEIISNDHDATDFGAECFVLPQSLNAQPLFYLIEGCIYRFNGLFGHGMSTFTVREGTPGAPIVAPRQILKAIWRGETSPSDVGIVDKLKADIPELEDFLPIMDDLGNWDAKALDFPWVKMAFPGPKNGERMALQFSLTEPNVHPWEVETLDNFKKIFKDCLTVHHLAWSKAGILHGSISEQSLGAYKQPKGSTHAYNGIIKHWELGTQHPHRTSFEVPNFNSRNLHPFDTCAYMAIDLADDSAYPHDSGAVCVDHFYRHDLESFFYILVWACVHYSLTDKHRDAPHPHENIQGWLKPGRSAECKKELLLDDMFFVLLVTDLVKGEWAWLAQNWIVPLRNMFADALRSILDQDSPEHDKYDLETCNGRITFDNFMNAISDPCPLRSSL